MGLGVAHLPAGISVGTHTELIECDKSLPLWSLEGIAEQLFPCVLEKCKFCHKECLAICGLMFLESQQTSSSVWEAECVGAILRWLSFVQ